jgi:hypothetical protein
MTSEVVENTGESSFGKGQADAGTEDADSEADLIGMADSTACPTDHETLRLIIRLVTCDATLGWLDRVVLGLVDYEGMLLLSRYSF